MPGITIRLLCRPATRGLSSRALRDVPFLQLPYCFSFLRGSGDPEALLGRIRRHGCMLVAFEGEQPVGFVLAHELPRRHGDRANLFIYEIDVAESHQRRGIASTLLSRLAELARERGIRTGFVLTEPGNGPANALYRSAGGATDSVTVEWTFEYAAD